MLWEVRFLVNIVGAPALNLDILDTLAHAVTYTLRPGGVMDCKGNVMPDALAITAGKWSRARKMVLIR